MSVFILETVQWFSFLVVGIRAILASWMSLKVLLFFIVYGVVCWALVLFFFKSLLKFSNESIHLVLALSLLGEFLFLYLFCFSLACVEKECHVAIVDLWLHMYQNGLDHLILLPLVTKCWDYRHVPQNLTWGDFLLLYKYYLLLVCFKVLQTQSLILVGQIYLDINSFIIFISIYGVNASLQNSN